MRSSVVLLTFFICGFLYANDGLAQKPRLAVFPMSDVSVETEVRSHIVGSNQFLVEPADTTLEVVQGGKELGISCKATDTKCLVELGRLGDLAYFFVGASRGSKLSFSLITVTDGRVKQGKTIDLKSKTRGEDLRVAVLELVHPDGLLAQVAIDTGEVKADVYINGQAVGTTPLPQALFLEAGEHELSLKADGYNPYSRKVTVKHGQIVNLDVGLVAVAATTTDVSDTQNEDSTVAKVFSHPLGITSAVVGGIAFLGGAIFGTGGFGTVLFFESAVREHNPAEYSNLTDYRANLVGESEQLNIVYYAAAAIGFTGLVLTLVGAGVLGGGLGITFAIVE